MGFSVDEAWLKKYQERTGIAVDGALKQPCTSHPTRSKYGNQKTLLDGQTFDSLHEAERYSELKLRRAAREIAAFSTQVIFELPGKTKYIADFVVMYPDGHYEVEDAKSAATRKDKAYRIKRRLMLDAHGIEIKEV